MQKLNLRVWCEAYYDTEIEVPDGLSLEQAYRYAEDHLDGVEPTELHYLDGSDNLDHVDIETGYIAFEEEREL
jgi:hypothetical protein